MKYTIEQINEAWRVFIEPKWMVNKREIDPKELKKGFIETDNIQAVNQVIRTDFISFLIAYTYGKTKVVKKKILSRNKKDQ